MADIDLELDTISRARYGVDVRQAIVDALTKMNEENKNGKVCVKNLGNTFTDEQKSEIYKGTFKGLYLGSYWTIEGQYWRIWGFNWYKNKAGCNKNHVVIIPDGLLLPSDDNNSYMNTTATSSGGYKGTNLRTTYLPSLYNGIINRAFGTDYVLKHREFLSTSVDSYSTTDNCSVEIPSEIMLYGTCIFGKGAWQVTSSYPILPLALLRPDLVYAGRSYWLRDIYDSQSFANVVQDAHANVLQANHTQPGVRPYFFLYSPTDPLAT